MFCVANIILELDDRVVHDPIGYVVVASLDLCVGGVWLRDTISGLERTTRRSVSRYISGRCPHEFRSLWKSVVCLQSGRNGLVRTPDSFPPRVCVKNGIAVYGMGCKQALGGRVFW